MLTITVVTPWLNHRELERDYWNAIHAAGACEVLIIDNGSTPRLPNGIRLAENTGFSHACNVGLQASRSEAVLFLNNDIEFPVQNWLDPIREALEPGVLVGANLRFDPHGNVDGQSLPYLDGWCLAGMRDDLLDLGGFDEAYMEPSYYGDNDLCLRARAAGMALREASVGLRHKANVTAGPATNPDVARATEANRARYIARARELLGRTPCSTGA